MVHTGLIAAQAAMIWKAATTEDGNVRFGLGYGMLWVTPLTIATGVLSVKVFMPPEKEKPRSRTHRRAEIHPLVAPTDRTRGAVLGLAGSF